MQLMNTFQYDFTDTVPFVFSRSNNNIAHVEIDDELINAPTEKFTIEVDNGYITTEGYGDGGLSVDIDCIFCHEVGPDDYRFIISIHTNFEYSGFLVVGDNRIETYVNNQLTSSVTNDENYRQTYNSIKTIVKQMLKRLEDCRIGFYNESGKVKFKNSSGNKRTYKPKNVVYIAPKNHSPSQETGRKNIRWSEGWSVMSHWRRINPESYGVDRNGERSVKGLTFIHGYNKGDSSAIEQMKIRRVS